ncbi:MAG: CDP-diacylglycerol--glycerol-3-phosphate 3-phosphatidyltransferase [Deltaproteobacteria bacterium]|nr:CDP-diacylglycerol--glycerol-3-phosphate 3-phosphatidyltransferase [Deltaproteobacteria bacterium]MBW2072438.1 CDP-diacylglycerol--glycerol-3-phosphate 3-phosphatidyltransferase [Deltaproteobacteria bacterium]
MTVPNLLTLVRILLTPLLVILLLEHRLIEALVVFGMAGLTDGLDGLIARLYRQKSRLGAFLDPMADKLLISSTYVILAYQRLLPKWLSVIVLSRDVLIVLGFLVLFMQNLKIEIKPSLSSKLTTCAQIVTVIVAMGSAIASPHPLLRDILFYFTAVCTVVSWTQYMVRGVRLMQEAGNDSNQS